jgi:2-keto-4-pentenoate hydratase
MVARDVVMQPRIEAEIAFVMKEDLAGSNITPEAVIAATDYVVPAIEVCGSRIAEWNIHIEDTIADNASSGNFMGRTPPVGLGLDLSGIVIAAGHGMRGVAVGDAVAAMADLNGNGGWSATGGAEAKAVTPWHAISSPSASRHP